VRTVLRLAALAMTAAALLCLVAPGPPASAVEGVESGWWWASQPDGRPFPPPPHVPQHGLWVSTSPSGPQAVSAIRFQLGANESGPIVTLHVHTTLPPAQLATAGIGPPLVVACPATAAWKPADAGAWSARPTANCGAGAVGGALSADGRLMGFDLTTIATSKAVDVVLLPGPAASLVPPPPVPVPGLAPPPVTAGFDVTFEPVGAGAVSVFTSPSEEEEFGPGASLVTPPLSLETSSLTSLSTLPPVVAAPETPAAGPPRSTVRPSVRPFRNAAVVAVDDDRTTRILAAVVFLALSAWWYRLSFSAPSAGPRARASLYDVPTGPRPSALRQPAPAAATPPPPLR